MKNQKEIWKPLIFDELDKIQPRYLISSYGNLRAYTPNHSGEIYRGKNYQGYYGLDVTIRNGKNPVRHGAGPGTRKVFLLHYLFAQEFLRKPNSKEKNKVIFLDYDRQNNHPDNLKWVTRKDQYIHARLDPNYRLMRDLSIEREKETVEFIKELIRNNVSKELISTFFRLPIVKVILISKGEYDGLHKS